MRPLSVLRITVSMCVVLDLLRILQVGMVKTLFTPYSLGGLSKTQDDAWWLDDLIGAAEAGPTAFWITLVCMTCSALGIATRPAMFIGIFAYAQLGHGYPPGDRAIDRVLRITLFLLLFTNAHKRFSLDNLIWKRVPAVTTPLWMYDVMKWLLVMIYMGAGIAKIAKQPGWLGNGRFSPLYRIVTDPLAGHLDANYWIDFWPVFLAGSWFTIIWEIGAFVILSRLGRWWALGGAFMHLGIAMTMELGMFSWGMLALYPILWADWLCRGLDKHPKTAGSGATLPG
ncbi:MAG: HTTM domain-containing protein [Proteobacteria bacterium]|nr:HTTM domain-containing protein [Pseudomonadota bacterium]